MFGRSSGKGFCKVLAGFGEEFREGFGQGSEKVWGRIQGSV